MRRWLPYPVVALGLLGLWLLLVGRISPGALLLGSALAIAGSATLVALMMPIARMRRLSIVPGLLFDIAREVVRSNNAVTWIILGRGQSAGPRSGFVRIPLDMRSPHGLAALTCILTATPGTVWVEYDSSDRTMLLHVLDLIDDEAWVRIVKDRWERRLMEIFE
jgi:multicomponent K+:H+ antiporter subunit E